MNEAQTLVLTRFVKSMCPAQQIDEFTPDAWHLVLKGFDFDDAKSAVIELAGRLRFIAVADIAIEIKRVRAARFNGVSPELLGSGADPNDVPAFLDKVRADRKAIGDGEVIADRKEGELRPVEAFLMGSGIARKAIGPGRVVGLGDQPNGR